MEQIRELPKNQSSNDEPVSFDEFFFNCDFEEDNTNNKNDGNDNNSDDNSDDSCDSSTNTNDDKQQSKVGKFTKIKTIYENKELFSMEGELIGFIPERRYNWYIKRGLCKVLDEKSIMLTFQPNYKNEKVVIDREKQAPKQNICVVCGCTENLKRFRVVPYEIKKLFPENNKAHMSSDVVVICETKAADGDYYNKEFKLKMFEEYQVDLNDFKIDSKKKNIYLTVQKLAKQNFVCNNIHTAKSLETYFKKEPTKEDMVNLINEVENFTFEGFKTPEEMLVAKVIKLGDVQEFIKRWKHNFYDTMNPQYLQWDYWNCDQCF